MEIPEVLEVLEVAVLEAQQELEQMALLILEVAVAVVLAGLEIQQAVPADLAS